MNRNGGDLFPARRKKSFRINQPGAPATGVAARRWRSGLVWFGNHFLLYLFHSLPAAKFFGNNFTIRASY
jgi:hypothetical protein